MKKIIAFILCLILVVIVLTVISNININKNSNITSLEDLEFKNIDISELKLNRYNELINTPQVMYFIRNLPVALERDKIDIDGAISCAYIYAYNFDDDFDKFVNTSNNKIYAKKEYIESIIFNLFNKQVDLKNKVVMNDNISISMENMKNDTASLKIQEILYNEENDLYKIVIAEGAEGSSKTSSIEMIYKYNNYKYIILWCLQVIY